MAATGETSAERVKVWDVPTRLFHWLLAGSFAVAWFTHEHDRYLDVHVFAGYLFFGLLLFRLVWGFAGGCYARFHAFNYSRRAARDYLLATLRGDVPRHLGHNPAGAWAIFFMLGLGLAVALTGVLVLGGEEGHGPFAGWLSFSAAGVARELHEMTAVSMLVLVLVHLAGVAFESWRHRENLVAAMITGYKSGRGMSTRVYAGVGVLMLVVVLVAAGFQFMGYASATAGKPYLPFAGPALPENATWNRECGSCHLAFHPRLLPARSWDALLDGQANHFGDDLGLDAATLTELREFARQNAAESAQTEAAWKINRSVPAQAVPLRITETAYFQHQHDEISASVWKRPKIGSQSNCIACHSGAEKGNFSEDYVRIPR